MQTFIMVVLSATVLLGGCAGQSKPSASINDQSESVVRNPYRYDDHRPIVRPRFDDAQVMEYRFVPARRYHGRGEFSHYNWVRQPQPDGR
jgi:hypothetical protein